MYTFFGGLCTYIYIYICIYIYVYIYIYNIRMCKMLVFSNKKNIILHGMENIKVRSFLLRASPGITCIQNTGMNETQEKKTVQKQ